MRLKTTTRSSQCLPSNTELDEDSELFKDLLLRPPKNMTDLMFTVDKYRELEEFIISRARKDPSKPPKEAKKQVNNIKEGAAEAMTARRRETGTTEAPRQETTRMTRRRWPRKR